VEAVDGVAVGEGIGTRGELLRNVFGFDEMVAADG